MKNNFRKMVMGMAAAVLLAGAASDVAYAHSNHHSQRTKTAICYASCYEDGVCTLNGSCDENGVCQDGGYCIETPCYQEGTVYGGAQSTGHHTGSRSAHHSKRGHRSHY